MKSTMIDIETLDIGLNAVVLSVGLCKFDSKDYSVEPYDLLYMRLDIAEQQTLGRTISDDTLEWWSKQPDKIKNDAFSEDNRESIDSFLVKLYKYCKGSKLTWANSPAFDLTILESLYKQKGKKEPWNYWDCRDVRTIKDFFDYDEKKLFSKNNHNALDDAVNQANLIRMAMKKIANVPI